MLHFPSENYRKNGYPNEEWVFTGILKAGNLPRMNNKEVLANLFMSLPNETYPIEKLFTINNWKLISLAM